MCDIISIRGDEDMDIMSLQDFLFALMVLWGLKSMGDGIK